MAQMVFHVSSCWLCYDADHVTSNGGMIDELETIWKEVIMSNLRYYPNIFLKGLTETRKSLSQDSCVLAEIWTKYLPNASIEWYCYFTPPGTCFRLLI